jgi:hypothetical protein
MITGSQRDEKIKKERQAAPFLLAPANLFCGGLFAMLEFFLDARRLAGSIA